MATFSGTTTSTIILGNPPAQNPVTVTSTGLVDVNSATPGAVGILGGGGFAWTITNLGTVESIGTQGVGIYLEAGGVVTNGGSSATGALIDGSYFGLVVSGGAGAVANFGTIEGYGPGLTKGVVLGAGGQVTNAGLITGAKNGVYIKPPTGGGGGTLLNYGTIASLGTISVNGTVQAGIGAYVPIGSIVQNGQSGSTGGVIEAYFIGVRIGIAGTSGAVGTITNFGTINVLSQNGTLPFDIGVQVESRSSVVNYGTITALGPGGGVGVQLPGGGVVRNGANGASSALIEGYIHAIGSGYDVNTTVVNFGTLASTGFGIVRQDTGAALLFHYGGIVANYGLIQGQLNGIWTGINGSLSSFAGSGTITNTGTIRELGTLATSFYPRAIYLHNGGTVTNGQSGSAAGLIQGGGNGIVVHQLGTVRNFGTVESLGTGFSGGFGTSAIALADGGLIVNGTAGATGALIEAYERPVYIGAYRGVSDPSAVGTVVNFGTITGLGTGTVGASSVAFVAAGTLVNYGMISSVASDGVDFFLSSGTITNAGTISSTASAGAGIALHTGGVITNAVGGVIIGLNDGIQLGGASLPVATVTNSGTISGSSAGICVNPTNNGSNTIVNFGTIVGTSGTAIRLGTISSALIVLGSASNLQGVVANMIVGDAFDLPFLSFSNSGTATLDASNMLQVVQPSGTFSIALDSSQSFAGDAFIMSSDSGGGTLVTEQANPCFCRGTLILTERGEVPVEDLAIGDRVVTLAGRLEPIKWIGRRAYDGRFIVGNRIVLPVRIAEDALSAGVPARELRLSPEHALYVDGVLVAARLLVNGTTIRQEERVDRVEYFHIELEQHDVILAEAVPVETYVECDNRGVFQNATEFALLYPDDRRARRFCAPRLDADADGLAAIQAMIDARAATLIPTRQAG